MTHKIISLIRHGKVAGPAALYGRTNIPLSEDGQDDLHNTLTFIHAQNAITHLIASPLLRCATVAQNFSESYALPLSIQPDFREMDFGRWDGIAFDKLGDDWQALEKFWESPATAQAPDGETLEAFAQRVGKAWQQVQETSQAEHLAIICHGGVIRIIIAHLLQMDWCNPALFKQLHIDYASHTRIEIGSYENALPVVRWIGASRVAIGKKD